MFETFKKIIIFLIILAFFGSGIVFAQEPDVENQLRETQEDIDKLIKAKDENSHFDVALCIELFKEATNLSITEAKNLKIKLIALDKIENERLINWKGEVIEELNEIISYYENIKENASENESSLVLEEIQQMAVDFKTWREENYIPLQDEIQNLLLIKKEKEALQISNRRLEKISNDIIILERAGFSQIDELKNMFENAEKLIENAEIENEEAMKLFITENTTPLKPIIEETATSTETQSTSTIPETSDESTSTESADTGSITANSSSTATSTESNSTSTLLISTSTPSISTSTSLISTSTLQTTEIFNKKQERSIRGLISASWENIKGAYQTFIEMSSFVRKLLE